MTKDNDDDKKVKKGPWGSKTSKPKSTGSNDGQQSPEEDIADIEEFIKNAHSSFGGVFGNGGNYYQKGKPTGSGEGKGIISILFLIIVCLWLATGFYRVQPEENAVVLTFGKWTNTKDNPGLGYVLPWPIQEVRKVNVSYDRRVKIGYRDSNTSSKRQYFSRNNREGMTDVKSESIMLTGDENIVDIDFFVMWNISDAKNYLFEIRDPETTIKKVAESAMREVIGQSKIQSALTEGRAEIEGKARTLMQAMLDEYKSGVVVNNVQLLSVNPPETVVDAFDDVQRARADKERARNEGEAYRNDIVPKARGKAQQILQAAEAYKESVINKSKGDAGRFLSVYKAYKVAKDVTKKRLYLETMQEIMGKSKKFIIGSEKGNPILPYLPLEQIKK